MIIVLNRTILAKCVFLDIKGENYEKQEDLWNDNFKLYKEIDLEYHKFATHYKLSDSEFYILNSLFQANAGISQQEIFTQWGYAKQTINSSIKSLEKKVT